MKPEDFTGAAWKTPVDVGQSNGAGNRRRRLFLLSIFLVSSVIVRAEVPASSPDIFTPDWLVSYFPPTLLVLKSSGSESIQKPFRDALARVQGLRSVKLVDFPANQQRPVEKHPELWENVRLNSGDASFLVLVSQTGRVAALSVAFSTDKDWARTVAPLIAKATFEPAKVDGRPVPVLLCWRVAVDHRITPTY